jgi:DNA end-binding protein Ku
VERCNKLWFNKCSNYLAPEDTGKKAYKLLVHALKETEKIAIAKVVIRSKESLVCLRVYNEILVMETMHYPDEIELIEGLATDFSPEKYQDNYRTKLLEIIQNKA